MIEPDMGGLDRAARAIAAAARIVVATGAGMSRESGIPTFRDAREGLWERYDPAELATREAFCSDPARVWGWYGYRRRLIHRCEPHAGHRVLARLQATTELVVVTQNIDGLHQRAGSRRVVELHGNIDRFKCLDAHHPVEGDVPVPARNGPAEPPLCERCGSRIRPDVVWFGESLPSAALELAERLASSCDVMLVVGTSGLVYPAAGLPHLARVSGATTIEINTRPSELTPHLDIFLRGPAGHVLPLLLARLEGEGSSGESDG
jgi:NAD-dependent deacetylase